jgi:hypothetical protein
MKDFLQDVIQYMHGINDIDLVKVVGTDKETKLTAVAEDKTVVVSSVFKHPVAEAIGTFGMPNLSTLKTILSFSEDYDENSQITTVKEDRDGEMTPTTILFETKNKDFSNSYRLMIKTVVENRIKNVTLKVSSWNIEFEPSIHGVQRLKRQAQANSTEPFFTTKVENGDLKIYFGDHSTHSGNFVFQAKVNGTMAKTWNWPVKAFLTIMDMPGTKTIKMSDMGVTEITVDSGLAVYTYMLPAQTK